VSHSAGLAGAERSLLELVETLSKMGVGCSVVVPYKGPLFGELKKRRIEVFTVPYAWWMGSSSAITSHRIRRLFTSSSVTCRAVRMLVNMPAVPLIAAQIRARKCGAVYTNSMTTCVGALAAWLARRRHLWRISEFGFEDFGLVFDLGERLSLRLMDRLSSMIVPNSHAVAHRFASYFRPGKVRVIYGSVSPRNSGSSTVLQVPGGTDIRCVIVGLIREAKNQEEAILAIAELHRMGLKPLLWIVGAAVDRQYERHLRRLVKDLELERFVQFFGWMDDPFPALLQADVVLVCSKREAFGRVAVEGMLAGKPVIGTRTGGTLELVRDGFNGLLYSPGDHEDLARKIAYLHEHPSEGQQMGKSGRDWAQRQFSQTRFAEDVLSVLRQVLAECDTSR
jgi:glycosyltransferase involved in cell wall biosynthesis